MKNTIGIFFIMVFSGFSGAIAQQGMRLMNPMHRSLATLEEMNFTGDPDHDYANMILIHYKGGIDMLDEVIEYGKDPETIGLAREIRERQEKDIEELEKFVAGSSPSSNEQEFVNEMRNNHDKAEKEMIKNMDLSGVIDKDFLRLMSVHHQHGIDMTRTAIDYVKDPSLKEHAQKMLDEQQREKQKLDDLK